MNCLHDSCELIVTEEWRAAKCDECGMLSVARWEEVPAEHSEIIRTVQRAVGQPSAAA